MRIRGLPSLGSSIKRVAALLRAPEGNAVMEFGLVAPLLGAILVPLVDVGIGFYQSMQVQDAAQAGAQYAMAHGWNSTAIQNAVTSATTLSSVNASPVPSRSCGCASNASVVAATCGSNCPDGKPAGTYVTVSAQALYKTLIPYPAVGSSVTLSAQSTARIQ
jgi:Flp pilus assembly protein TadG